MANTNGTTSESLIGLLSSEANRFDFFAAVRLLEALHPDKARFGNSVKAGDDPARFSQDPNLLFPPTSIAEYQHNDAHPPRLAVNFFGLFGPNGALPLHLTEYARDRLHSYHDPTFARFADIFHHRMLSLFYRAWANSRPETTYDRPESDHFAFHIGALQGMAGESFRHRDAFEDHGKLFYCGHIARLSKNPAGLQAIIGEILNTKVRIEEFVGEWMEIQIQDQSRLGYSATVATLGQSLSLGKAVWGCQHKFRIILGPLKLKQYLSLLPGAEQFAQLLAMVRYYLGDELVWDVNLLLEKQQVPPELILGSPEPDDASSMKGQAQLGWSMWLGPRPGHDDADDLMLNPLLSCVN